jgi:hypothetical protein
VIDLLVVLSLFIGGFPIGAICYYDFGLLLFSFGVLLSMAKLSHDSFDRDQTLEV